MARKPGSKSIGSRLTAVERGMGLLLASDTAIINELRDGFARVESRLDQIYNHIDGFVKLHETLDMSLKSSKSR
jgi:hypothetical protein